MAIGWLTLLKVVPWGEVIENAPRIAEGAKKLWNKAANRSTTVAAPPSRATPDERLAILESTARELQAQALESSNLLKELAEQNTQLIQRMDALRRKVRWLALAICALAISLVVMARFIASAGS